MEEMKQVEYSTNIGDYLVIWITGCLDMYIAQVVQFEPLRLKVTEQGPYSTLKNGDFVIRDAETALLQLDDKNDTSVFLDQQRALGHKVLSGLRSLGVEDGELYEFFSPAP